MDHDIEINVLFVVNWLKRRGAEQQLFSFVKMLPHNINISIFRFSYDGDEFPEFFGYDRVKIHSNKYKGTYNIFKFKSLYNCLSQEKFDIVITIGLGAALFFGRANAFLSGIDIVYSILNTFENFHKLPRLPGDYFDFFNRAINYFVLNFGRKRIFRFLPNSDQLSNQIRMKLEKYPVQTLYNGLPTEDFEKLSSYKPKNNTCMIHNRFAGYPTIVQVGALDDNKNYSFTLKSFVQIKKMIPNARFLIIGDGPKKAELIEKTTSIGSIQHVIFAGHMNRMECLYLMSKSSLLVLTSKSESFPNALVEGQALSLPAVSFDVGAASDIIEHGVSGYVTRKGDLEAFTEYIITLLSDKELANRMGKRGEMRVFDLFSMKKKVDNFLAMIAKDSSITKYSA